MLLKSFLKWSSDIIIIIIITITVGWIYLICLAYPNTLILQGVSCPLVTVPLVYFGTISP